MIIMKECDVTCEVMRWFELLIVKRNEVWIQLYDRPFIM